MEVGGSTKRSPLAKSGSNSLEVGTPGRGGGTWFQLYPDVCVEKGRTWVRFRLRVSEMSDMISLKMGVNNYILLPHSIWVEDYHKIVYHNM